MKNYNFFITFLFIFFIGHLYSQDISGIYYVNNKIHTEIIISKLEDNIYKVTSNDESWKSVGFFYEKNQTLMLVYKYDEVKKYNYRGIQSAILQKNGNFKVSIRHWRDVWNKSKEKIHRVKWIKQ